MDRPDDKLQNSGANEGLTSLGLRVPQQAPPPPDSFLLDAKASSAWFAALPMANIGETARQIFNALVDSNRMELSEVVRARVIEQFRDPVEYLCKNLERHYVDLGMPLSGKGRKTASLAQELQSELAIGYKIIIEGQLASDAQHFDEKLLVIALHRALLHLGQVVYQTALVYGPWQAGLWREINGIYAYAAQNEVHGVPVKDGRDRAKGRGNTIEDLYKSLMLFAAADPLRLRQSQIKQVYREAAGWARYVQVRAVDVESNAAGLFNIDLVGDLPPVHNALRAPTGTKRGRIIDLRGLVRTLREEFDRDPATETRGDAEARPSKALCRQLIATWTKPSERRFMRTHLNFELRLAVGLGVLHNALGGAVGGTNPAPQGGLLQQATMNAPRSAPPRVPTWAAGISGDTFTLAPTDGPPRGTAPRASKLGLREPREHDAPDDWTKPAPSEGETAPHPANTINESAGGYCIRWSGEQTPRVKVGEVVGIQSTTSDNQFGVGLIRWLKQDPSRDLEVGLEILTPRCRAGEIRVAGDSPRRSQQPRHICLLLPETNRGAGDTSLLTSAEGLQGASDVWLLADGTEQQVELTRLIESTGAVARYAYNLVSAEDDDSADEDSRGTFDDLWSSL